MFSILNSYPTCEFVIWLDVLQAEKVFAKVKQLEPYRIEGKQSCKVDMLSVTFMQKMV